MGFYENSYRLKDGAIVVYARPGRKKTTYQARLKVPGVTGYIIKSLKTSDLNAAISAAEDLFHDLKAEQKLGLDVKAAGNLKFNDFWKRFYAVHEAGLSALRHAFGAEATLKKISPLLVQKWMGHARIETTQIYTTLTGDEERSLARIAWQGAGGDFRA